MNLDIRARTGDKVFLSHWNEQGRLFPNLAMDASVADILIAGEPHVPADLIGVFAMCIFNRIAMYKDTPEDKEKILVLFESILPRLEERHQQGIEECSYVWPHLEGYAKDQITRGFYRPDSMPFMRRYLALMKAEDQSLAARLTKLDNRVTRLVHAEHATVQ